MQKQCIGLEKSRFSSGEQCPRGTLGTGQRFTIEQVLSMSEDKLQDIYTAFLVRLMFVFPAICPREVETRLFYKDKLEFRQLCSVF